MHLKKKLIDWRIQSRRDLSLRGARRRGNPVLDCFDLRPRNDKITLNIMREFFVVQEKFMQLALNLARRGQFTARPNPCVGAVIVNNGQIVGEGYHAYYGGDHAEIMALKQAKEFAQGATLYVTLEPCSHHGKTPPCVEAVIKAGVSKVVIACIDPNPLVNGRGIQQLRDAGIQVELGLLALNVKQLNAGFMHRVRHNRPRVIVKSAMSLDGRTAMSSGESQWITGPQARAQVQVLRAQCDAIITGRGTVESDDPHLNVRDEAIIKQTNFKQPKRIILDSQGKIKQAKCFEGDFEHITSSQGRVSLSDLLNRLAQVPCNQVMVEAGAVLAGAFLKAGLVDEWHVFIAPKLMGNSARPLCDIQLDTMAQAQGLSLMSSKIIGEDLYCIYSL
jgi:diaminohydroxyphosphoribosylaminopyrimidine deaminase/5-amino-6-(5-phosphoribosylamino)uracil reductase